MIFKILVLSGIAIYFAVNQQWFFCVWTLVCLIPRFGLGVAIALAITLILRGLYIPGAVLAVLIAFNLIGNDLVKKKLFKEMIQGVDMVKTGTYRRLTLKYKDNYGNDSGFFAAAVVNELFLKFLAMKKPKTSY